MSFVATLTNPDKFFREMSEEPGLLSPTFVVLLAAVFGAASAVPMMQYVTQSLQGEASGAATIIYVSGLAGGFLVTVVAWVVLTGIFHVITAVAFDGNGSFRTNLALVGWGYIPAVFSSVISTFGYFVVFNDKPPQSISNPQRVQAFMQSIQSNQTLQVLTIISIVFTIWQGFIWTYAVKHGRNVSDREAAITVAIPVGVLVLFSANSLI